MPLIAAASKSGGIHLYLFIEEWVLAKDVRRLLKHFASMLDIKSVDRKTGKEIEPEIFPKQDKLAEDQYGNGINLPYFSSFKEENNPSSNNSLLLDKWIKRAIQRRLSVPKFNEWIDWLPHLKNNSNSDTKLITHYEQLRTMLQENDDLPWFSNWSHFKIFLLMPSEIY